MPLREGFWPKKENLPTTKVGKYKSFFPKKFNN